MKTLLLCLLLSASIDWTFGARILAVFPVPSKSHHNLFQAVLKTLAERGHQIVCYTPQPLDKPVANYTEIVLDGIESPDKSIGVKELQAMMELSPIGGVKVIWFFFTQVTRGLFENKSVQKLINSDEKFDLVILEAFFAQEVLLGFGHKFKAPVVNLQPFGAFSLVSKAAGNSLALPYIPDFSFPYSDHMSFYERFLNSYSILSSFFLYYTYYLPSQDKALKEVFKDPTMPPVVDLIHNISLFVNNANPTVHYVQPYTPNMISVGGIHLAKTRKPLPPEMKKFLDEAKQGVVYVSLGSVVPDHLLPPEFFENFIKVFRRLKQRVLWKTGSQIKDLPDNVMTAKWMPQQDVLAHPNIDVFVTHGGLFGQHEAINAGVPVVCIPFFGDQPLNAKFYEERQIGVKIPFKALSEDTIYSALSTILNNPKYKENMKRLSRIYRDRPLSPADNLVFWVEYVMKHGGAPHLRPASSILSWYQLALVDVVAAILAALSTVILVLYLIVKRVVRFCRGVLGTKPVSSDKKVN